MSPINLQLAADEMDDVVRLRRFTVDEYYRMAGAGILGEDDHVELLDGQVVELSPIGSTQALCVSRLNMIFAPALAGRALVVVQNPVRLDGMNEPEPDVSIVDLGVDSYGAGHPGPGDVYLLIEVSDASVRFDRSVKLPLYARFGVPEFWLVDLQARQVEIYTSPDGACYASVLIETPPAAISPAAFPDVSVDLEALLPPDGTRIS